MRQLLSPAVHNCTISVHRNGKCLATRESPSYLFQLFFKQKLSPRLTGYAGNSNCLSSSCMDFTLGTWPLLKKSLNH